ncbi:thermostable hemolysin [Thalassotalea montiporae]
MMQAYSLERHFTPPLFVPQQPKALDKSAEKQVIFANRHSSSRAEIAQFIQSGFRTAYGASIQVSMPYLIAIEQSKKKASLGFRGGHLPLFVEQYFHHTIEQHPFFKAEKVARNNIVEIGHLYSNSRMLTLPLFMVTALSLQQLGFDYLVFSASHKVKNIIEKGGIQLDYLVDACPEQLRDSDEHWGSYYQTNPKVYALSLKNIVDKVRTSPYHRPYRHFLNAGVDEICEQYLTQLTQQYLAKQYLSK